jgi:hypothetical protein
MNYISMRHGVQCCGLKLAIEDLVADRPTWTASKKMFCKGLWTSLDDFAAITPVDAEAVLSSESNRDSVFALLLLRITFLSFSMYHTARPTATFQVSLTRLESLTNQLSGQSIGNSELITNTFELLFRQKIAKCNWLPKLFYG